MGKKGSASFFGWLSLAGNPYPRKGKRAESTGQERSTSMQEREAKAQSDPKTVAGRP